jgi:hypothetical protein
VRALAFAPDGRTLATGSDDTTALVWDLSRWHDRLPAPVALSPVELEECWDDLRRDAPRAGKAVARLARAESAVAYLSQRLRPAPPADLERVRRLVDGLSGPRYPARQEALTALRQIGAPALPALRKALSSPLQVDARKQIEVLIEAMTRGPVTSDALRQGRAVEALEQHGTAEARALLTMLARGAAGHPLTVEARQALERRR